MTRNFVVELLQVLHASEKAELKLFLESPYFNKGYNRLNLLGLFELLDNMADQDLGNLNKVSIFKHLFPGKPVLESKIDKLLSELKTLCITFLEVEHYLSDRQDSRRSLDLAKVLRQRKLDARYIQTLDRVKKDIHQTSYKSSPDLFLRYELEFEEHEWHSENNKLKGDLNIPEVIQHLDHFYLVQRTELLNRLILQQKLSQLPEIAQNLLNSPWTIEEHITTQNPLLKITWFIHRLLRKESPEASDYFNLLQEIQQYGHHLKAETLKAFFSYVRNVCTLMINNGFDDFYGILHQVHEDNLARGYFYFNEKIMPGPYLNITVTALMVRKLDWALQFVDEHRYRLGVESETEEFYKLNKALCLFYFKKYDEALELIPFGTSFSYYHLFARRLELKIYYELNSDLLPYKIDAFKMYISRVGNKMLTAHLHEVLTNFVNMVRQLGLSNGIKNPARSAQLVKRIQEKKFIAERAWLLEKARELGSKKR